MSTSFTKRLGRQLSSLARQQEFSGAVLIRQGASDLFRRAYGLANRTWGIKNHPETRFRIASVGKMFTAAAIMQLIKAGKLGLETRVAECLGLEGTSIPAEATIYHMLTMTSGIADWVDEEAEDYPIKWAQFCRDHPIYLLRSDQDYLPIFAYQEPYDPVGAKYHYNGAGYMLLGLVVEKITGQTYFNYIRQHIFAQAGMAQTDFLDLDDVVPNVAEGYIPVKDHQRIVTGWKKNYYVTTAGPAADGGVTSTVEDLARYVRAIRQGQVISPEKVALMCSPQVVVEEDNITGLKWHYGFGCYVQLDRSGNLIRWGHAGEEEGISCRLWHYPQHDLDVVILGNQSACAGKVSVAIQKLVLDF